MVLYGVVLHYIYLCIAQLTQPLRKGQTLAYLQEWQSEI